MPIGEEFQPRKREAASLAYQRCRCMPLKTGVSTPQAGSGLFSLKGKALVYQRLCSFNPASGKRPL